MIPEEILSALKTKHGNRLYIITVGDEEFAAVPPSRDLWRRFVVMVSDVDTKPEAYEGLVLGCVVHPEKTSEIWDERPGLFMTIGNKLSEMAGMVSKVESKKA